jgi:hypothetical protein
MLRTLKIAKFSVAVAAICFIAYLTVSGLKPDDETETILAKPSAVDMFRESSNPSENTKNKESEFVRQAHEFALRIKPPTPIVITQKSDPITSDPITNERGEDIPPPPPPTKYSLVATCRYEDEPGKSLAQFNILAEGKKWIRQGESIGRLTIHEVKDGSVILYQGGTMNAEIFMSPPKEIKSLFKSI